MKKILCGISIFSVFYIGCSLPGPLSQGTWTADQKNTYIQSCTQNESSSYCSCAADKLEKEYSNPQQAEIINEDMRNKVNQACR